MSDKKTSWGAVAEWYDDMIEEGNDSYQKKVLMPNLIRLVEPKPGLTILDVACGQGYFARAFAENGATVFANDISPELIAAAKKHASKKEVTYHVASSDSLSFMADASSDVVTIILALQNIENIQGTMAECARVLKPGGKIVLVLNHPSFRIPQNSSWQWESDKKPGSKAEIEYRRIDSYMSESHTRIDMTPGELVPNKKKFTVTFHRPLQSYFKVLTKNNLMVTRCEEWISHKKSQNGPRAAEEDRMRKEIPMFLCMEAKKV